MTTTALPRGASALPAVRRLRIDPPLLAVLALAGVLTLWGLTSSGYSNEYYAAAAKAGSESWTALFFGSLDPGSFITVDKPPLSLWLMGLSARALGFSSFSILLPQALCTIAAVALLDAAVKRVFGRPAGLLAAGMLAITPVTVAIARVNNPDALLVLLMVGAAYLLVRALESGRTRHLLWCAVLIGLAFMTKMLQGWMLLPALAAAYALAGPPRLAVRLAQLAAAGAVTVAVSVAWPLAVTLWPGDKPFIGGSEDGGVWDLILGYNGLGRIFGEGGGMGGGGGMFGGTPGFWRMLNEQVGGQVVWLLPLALVSLGAGFWRTRGEPRTGLRRAGWVLFGAWALLHLLVFSYAQGIFHPYYVSALAPAVAALSGAGLVAMWRWAKESWAGAAALLVALLATAYVAVALLARTPDFAPWLSTAIPVAAALGAFGVVARRVPGLLGRRALAVAAVAGVLAMTAGPAAYSVATAGRALNGNDVSAGPASAERGGPGGGGGSGGASADADLIAYLQANQGSAKYLVAATGSQTTAGIIIATGEPVVTIGGFSGGDAAPTVGELAELVETGQLKYVLVSGQGGGPGGGNSGISAWVQEHGTVVEDAGTTAGTLYRVGA